MTSERLGQLVDDANDYADMKPDPVIMFGILQDLRRLRECQRQYFKTKDVKLLGNCKAMERSIDERLAEIFEPKAKARTLFDPKTTEDLTRLVDVWRKLTEPE